MDPQDKSIVCATCGREFIFTVKEQHFFASKSFKEPRHCRECRQQRKQGQVQGLDQALSPQPVLRVKEMFRVVCGNCKRETYVPFRPFTGKPVLCKDCFIAQRYGVITAPSPTAEKKPPRDTDGAAKAEAQPLPPEAGGETAAMPPQPPDGQPKNAQPSASPESEPPPIMEQSLVPEPHKLAAKEPGAEPEP